jgi:hypothetical protein
MGRGTGDQPGQSPRHAVSAALDRLHEVLSSLDGVATWSLSDGELRDAVADVARVRSGVEALWLGLVRDMDARPGAVPGARAGDVAKTFLVHRARIDSRQAARDVAAARATDPDGGVLPGLGAALACGEANRGHVDAAVGVVGRIPARKLAEVDETGLSGAQRVDALLAEQARLFPPKTVEGLAREILHRLDPSGGDRYDPDAYTRRSVTCGEDSTGTVFGRFQLDPANGAVFKAALDAHAKPSPVTTASTPDGQQVLIRDDRTLQQRRADALMAIVRKAMHADTGRGGTGPAPTQVLVIATPDQVTAARRAAAVAEDEQEHDEQEHQARERIPADSRALAGLADCLQTGPLASGALGLLTCDAVLQAVLTTPSGAVLDLGRAVRTVSAAQKKALIVRDRACVIPGCTAPVAACDAHHVRWWRHGGSTDIANLVLLCGQHHAAVHAGIWSVVMTDGIAWVVPPRWVDDQQRPVRNTLPDARDRARRLGRQLRLGLRLHPDPPHHPDG